MVPTSWRVYVCLLGGGGVLIAPDPPHPEALKVHGPPRTPQEAVASVRREVERFEGAGLERPGAVIAAAVTLQIDPQKIAVLLIPKAA